MGRARRCPPTTTSWAYWKEIFCRLQSIFVAVPSNKACSSYCTKVAMKRDWPILFAVVRSCGLSVSLRMVQYSYSVDTREAIREASRAEPDRQHKLDAAALTWRSVRAIPMFHDDERVLLSAPKLLMHQLLPQRCSARLDEYLAVSSKDFKKYKSARWYSEWPNQLGIGELDRRSHLKPWGKYQFRMMSSSRSVLGR